MKLKGTIFFKNIGTGAWGILDKKGQEWRPVNMPNQLKYEGAEVEVTVKKADEAFSIHMWGTPVEILSFQTMTP